MAVKSEPCFIVCKKFIDMLVLFIISNYRKVMSNTIVASRQASIMSGNWPPKSQKLDLPRATELALSQDISQFWLK